MVGRIGFAAAVSVRGSEVAVKTPKVEVKSARNVARMAEPAAVAARPTDMTRRLAERRGRLAAAITVATALLATGGCGGGSSTGARTQPDPAGVLTGVVQQLDPGGLSAARMAAANTGFGFSLFRRLCQANPSANLSLSPASAAQALGMLAAGAAGDTQRKLSALLQLPTWSPHVVAALHEQATALAKLSQVTVSNHVFEQLGLVPTKQALDDITTAYAADLRQVDFADPGATAVINRVVSHDTHGLIPKLFDGPLSAGTRTVLADAIRLDAKWQTPFESAQPGRFRTAAGKAVSTSMMDHSAAGFASRSVAGWQSVVLPYRGGQLQAVALLPPADGMPAAGTSAACAVPSTGTLRALTAGPSTDAGVVLPRLDLSQTLSLTEPLGDLGLPLSGDYSGLGDPDGTISEVVQKIVMKVDKSGTTAAAATGVAIATSARVGGPVVTFDRPFLLLLQDTATHTPLFLTRVADPTSS